MKNYIVGTFTRETWATHGKRWFAAANQHKGKAGVLILHTDPSEDLCKGMAKVVRYDGNLFGALAKEEGVFLYASPNVRFQAEPDAMFAAATDKFAVVQRTGIEGQSPFAGTVPVYDNFWAAPSDLIDMLNRVVEMSFVTGCKPQHFEANFVGYFCMFFPWFKEVLTGTEYLSVFDAKLSGDYYVDPKSLKQLTAVGLDQPEARKAGILAGIVKPSKPLLTSDQKEPKMPDPTSVEG